VAKNVRKIELWIAQNTFSLLKAQRELSVTILVVDLNVLYNAYSGQQKKQ
jgi:hypothetical protein